MEVEDIPERCNRDKILNGNGKKLIEVCRSLKFRIVNGDKGQDKGIGEYTCQNYIGSSTIDYVIANEEFNRHIVDFKVDVFDPCMSDVHRPITCTIKVKQEIHIKNSIIKNPNKVITNKWVSTQRQEYSNSFDYDDFEELSNQLENIAEANYDQINDLISKVNKLYLGAAKATGMCRESIPRSSKKHSADNPWFDRVCKDARAMYIKTKRSQPRDTSGKNLIAKAAQCYKKILRQKRITYREELNQKLKQLKSKDSREY